MIYQFDTTKRFDKDLKRCQKRGFPIEKLKIAIKLLVENGCLPVVYHPHKLSGNHDGEWEAHITSDWLLTWYQNDRELSIFDIKKGQVLNHPFSLAVSWKSRSFAL
jgi:mRNA interferase YafQ